VELHDGAPFPVVCFDEEPAELELKLRQAGELVGLRRLPSDEPFFTDELRNAPAEGTVVPAELEDLYERLRNLAI
jgi:hypothetical protein